MSRSITTRVRCHRCFYGYVEATGEPGDVDCELERRGWRKDEDGNDICSFCVEAETARGVRLEAMRFAQAGRLLKAYGLDNCVANTERMIAAQNAVIGELRNEQA